MSGSALKGTGSFNPDVMVVDYKELETLTFTEKVGTVGDYTDTDNNLWEIHSIYAEKIYAKQIKCVSDRLLFHDGGAENNFYYHKSI